MSRSPAGAALAHPLERIPGAAGKSAFAQMLRETQTLAGYAGAEVRIRLYLEMADLDPGAVELEGAARDMWAAALKEAKNRGRLVDLVKAVQEDYDNNTIRQLLSLAAEVEHRDAGAGEGAPFERLSRQPVDAERHAAVLQASIALNALNSEIELVGRMIRRYREAQEARAHATAFKVRARYLSYGGAALGSSEKLQDALVDASDSLDAMAGIEAMAVVDAVHPPLASVSTEMGEVYLINHEAAAEHVRGLLQGSEDVGSMIKLRTRATLLENFWNECLGGLYTRINDGIEHIRTSAARMDRHA